MAARQSVTIPELIQSVSTVLNLYSGLNASYIRYWIAESLPPYRFENLVTFRFQTSNPLKFSGANRVGFLTTQILEVTAYSRYQVDPAGDDFYLTTNDQYGYYPLLLNVIDAFQGRNLFNSYNSITREPSDTATRLTIRPLQMLPDGTTPLPENSKPQYWVAGRVKFDMELVMPLVP